MLPVVARILIRTDVVPGPSIKPAVSYSRDVIGDQVVPQIVALVYRGPQHACRRIDRDANRIPNSRGINSLPRSVGIKSENIRAWILGRIIAHIRFRAYSHEHLLSIR